MTKLELYKRVSICDGEPIIKMEVTYSTDGHTDWEMVMYGERIADEMTVILPQVFGPDKVERRNVLCPHFADPTCPAYISPLEALILFAGDYEVCDCINCRGYVEGDWEKMFDQNGTRKEVQ